MGTIAAVYPPSLTVSLPVDLDANDMVSPVLVPLLELDFDGSGWLSMFHELFDASCSSEVFRAEAQAEADGAD